MTSALAAELTLGAHLAGDPGDLVGEGGQLVDHRVDGVLQLEDLAAGVDRDLLRQIALGHRRGDLGDAAHLVGEVARHGVDGLGEVLPRPGHAWHVGLAAEPSVGADLAGHAGHLGGEQRQLVDHAVEDLRDLAEQPIGVAGQARAEVAVPDRGQTCKQLSEFELSGVADLPSSRPASTHPVAHPLAILAIGQIYGQEISPGDRYWTIRSLNGIC
ncbi:hypothetical protein GCM10020219_046150 [Nonomuraea dietziae]